MSAVLLNFLDPCPWRHQGNVIRDLGPARRGQRLGPGLDARRHTLALARPKQEDMQAWIRAAWEGCRDAGDGKVRHQGLVANMLS